MADVLHSMDAFSAFGFALPSILAGLTVVALMLRQGPKEGSKSPSSKNQIATQKKGKGNSEQTTMRPVPSNTSLSTCSSRSVYDESQAVMSQEAFLSEPHLQGTLIPYAGAVHSNAAEPFPFENATCCGKFLPLHRPTANSSLDKSGAYPYGSHFKGRKRLWELRIQFRVKQPVQGNLTIGLELENYVPLNAAAKRMMGLTVAALRRVVGEDLYHSVGDDPSQGAAPHEKPVFMMPLWACDQLIVTPPGDDPPDLTDEHFSDFGTKRADDRAAFIEEMSNLQIVPESVYTVCFWGISQFLDCIKWEVQRIVPFQSIDFDKFCGHPPVAVVMYTLNPSEDGDTRHTQSRKNYFFRYALWSSLRPPSDEKLRELIPEEGALGSLKKSAATGRQSFLMKWSPRWLVCCVQPR